MNDDWKMICFACGALWDVRPERGVVKTADGIACTGNVLPRMHCPKCGEPEDIGLEDGANLGYETKEIGVLRYVEGDEEAKIIYGAGNAEWRWLKDGESIATLERKP